MPAVWSLSDKDGESFEEIAISVRGRL